MKRSGSLDAVFCNHVNRAFLGRRIYCCHIGTPASPSLRSASGCKRAQTSSVFCASSGLESGVWSGGCLVCAIAGDAPQAS